MSAFKDHFSAGSTAYAAFRPSYPEALVDVLAEIAPARTLALDVGCGSGQLATRLARAFDRVIATDASARQIEEAQAHPRVTYAVAPAEATGVAADSVDLVVAAQAAHWFDVPAFYAEARRVARPGAGIALVAYGILTLPEDEAAARVFARFYHDEAGPHWPPERAHVEAGYMTLPFPFPEIAPPALAIDARLPLAGLLGYVETWSALKGLRAARGEAPLDAFRRELAQAWGDPRTPRLVRWPLALRLGRVA